MTRYSKLLLWVLTVFVAPAQAFKLSPIEAEFGTGRQAVQTFAVENASAQPVAVELTVQARSMSATGEDILSPATDSFLVYPDQIVLQPGEVQSVRVQWTGNATPATETAYRLIAEQLLIDLGDGPERSGLRLLVKYLAALYVRPEDPVARLSATVASDVRDGAKVAVVKVRNDGNAHAILRADMLEVRAGGVAATYNDAQRQAVHGKNVLAGVERELVLPWSAALDSGALEVQLKSLDEGS